MRTLKNRRSKRSPHTNNLFLLPVTKVKFTADDDGVLAAMVRV